MEKEVETCVKAEVGGGGRMAPPPILLVEGVQVTQVEGPCSLA